eukprot:COSAG01_NODE_2685_length_7253_cov_6.363153_4_plen_45_part_00
MLVADYLLRRLRAACLVAFVVIKMGFLSSVGKIQLRIYGDDLLP